MSRARLHSRERGATLIELMVALVIGMILSLAMFVTMTSAEGRKRTITSTSDVNQAGNYAISLLDQWVRNAGSGFSQSQAYSFGCKLKVYRSNTQILPLASGAALPSPFGSVASTLGDFRLAPVLILPGQTTPGVSGQTSDVLVVMGGAAGTGGVPVPLTEPPTASQLTLNTTAFAANDLLLLTVMEPVLTTTTSHAEENNNAGDNHDARTSIDSPDCVIEQVDSGFQANTSPLGLGGTYHSTANGLASMTDNSSAMVIGNVVAKRPPQFQVIGVGDNNTLYSYDLLNTNGDSTRTALARADGVFELHALYGFDKNCDGKISNDEWVSPTDTTFSVSALTSGTMSDPTNSPTGGAARQTSCTTLTTGNDYLRRILAIRVGLILRTNVIEKDAVAASTTVTLFSDLDGLQYSRSLVEDRTHQEQHYRYRTVEMTIPLRNPLMQP